MSGSSHEFGQFVLDDFLTCYLSVAFKINQLHRSHTRFANVKSKSLGCYMVKPHGQLVLVS